MRVSDLIYGLSPVLEALRAGRRRIRKILLAAGAHPARFSEITDLSRRGQIPVERRDRRELDVLTRGANHQGIVAVVNESVRSTLADPEEILRQAGSPPLIVLLDNIEDPHNLGAILRTCEGAGVNGVFIPAHRSAPINETVAKTSAGAVEHVRVAQVTNLVPLIDDLKQRGFWVVGVEGGTRTLYTDFDMGVPLALVFGSEGKGIRRLVRENCDALVSIPMYGRVNSLNVSVAAGIILFEARRQRMQVRGKSESAPDAE